MVALWDCDSLFYISCYKLNEPESIEKLQLTEYDEETRLGLLAQIASARMEKMMLDILEDIAKDENNINITSQILFVTNCKKSIRKELSAEYKANRKPDALVNTLRQLYIFENEAIYSDILESDDLIADKAKELHGDCVIITSDKDLIQCGGFIYNFYRKPSKKDEQGREIEVYPRKGLTYTTMWQAHKFLAKQLISGDSGDRVQGLPRYGEVKSSKIIDPVTSKFGLIKSVLSEYKKVFPENYMEMLQLNFRLLYLGTL